MEASNFLTVCTEKEFGRWNLSQENDNSIDFEKIWFYFDAVARDRMDSTGLSRKTGEVLALRQKLLSLSESQFEAAMKTISKLVDDANVVKTQKELEEERKRKATLELFNRTSDMGNEKKSKNDKISRV